MAPKEKVQATRKGKTTLNEETTGNGNAHTSSSYLRNRQKFAREYVKDHNATRAAIRAGYSERSAYQTGHVLLKHLEVREHIAELERKAAKALEIEHHDILKKLWDQATADVNDLVRVEHRACRYCHGAGHKFQWKTEREYREAVDDFLLNVAGGNHKALIALGGTIDAGGRVPGMPDNDGGYGFDSTASPAPECPECNGEGITTVQTSDTRQALAHPLYDGVKQTKDGIEIKIADRGKALEQVARHLGFFNDSMKLDVREEFLQAARAINAGSPPLDAKYMAQNAHRLPDDEGVGNG